MIHTKIVSEELHKMISKLSGYTFEDSSYGNDESDSIINEELGIQIYFPNFLEYTTFSLQFIENDDIEVFDNLKDLIRKINNLQ